jgi:hypothetical protein
LFPDPNIEWGGLASTIDGIQSPSLEVVRADCSNPVRCLVSQWLEGACLRVSSVEFNDPQAFFAVEEMLYSIAYAPRQDGGGYDGTVYIKEAKRSALKTALEAVDYNDRSMRHFLLVGLDVCLEVVDTGEPHVKDHPDYDAARAWVMREAA